MKGQENKDKFTKYFSKYNSFSFDLMRDKNPKYEEIVGLYQKLEKKDVKEILNHENPIIRVHLIHLLIMEKNIEVDLLEVFNNEVIKSQSFDYYICFSVWNRSIASFIYNLYRSSLDEIWCVNPMDCQIKSKRHKHIDLKDKILIDFDHYILQRDSLDYDLYFYAFKNRHYEEKQDDRIIFLAKNNNFYAFKYLIDNKINFDENKYFSVNFMQAEFKTYDELMYLREYLIYLIEIKNDTKLALEKLRKEQDNWKRYSYLFDELIRRNKLNL